MTLVAAFVLALSTVAPVPPPDPLQQAKQSFQGTWRVVELTLDGKPEEKEELAKATCVVKSDRMEITFRGRDESVTFALDPKPNRRPSTSRRS
jgi:uncharacterized protein (TIGR03067 family)